MTRKIDARRVSHFQTADPTEDAIERPNLRRTSDPHRGKDYVFVYISVKCFSFFVVLFSIIVFNFAHARRIFMTVLMTAILIPAILLGVGVMTITKPKAKKTEQRSTGEVKVRIRHAGIPASMMPKEESKPDVIETGYEDMLLDNLDENPLESLAEESLSPERRKQILKDMEVNGYVLKDKAKKFLKETTPVIEEDFFEGLDDHPCDEQLAAPLDEFQDADYQ